MLDTLGLDPRSEQVYRGLLALPGAGVAALADHVGLSDADVRHGLDVLSELSLVRPSAELGGLPRAVSPDIGLDILMSRQQAQLAEQQKRLEESRVAAAQLIAEFADQRSASAGFGGEQLVGIDAIRDRLNGLTRDVREEVLAFSPDGAQTKENLQASRPLDRHLLGRGVRMRTVYLDSVRNSTHSVAYAQWLTELGGQVRTAPSLPTRMIIIDRTTAVIPVNSEDSAARAVVLTGQGMLTALCALFDAIWSAAQPLGEAPARDDRGLTAQEAATIQLLAEGRTDEAIAKRLGVSQRTARRIATGLMERLGARSRFEAGVLAVQAGWLPSRVAVGPAV
ncbi:helix-turn-helix transcriptional regulator [Streptomyces cinnamoneus]|uniref:Helix-turn-helix transcriptional regulator n=1 Tax=Streptomyces cinnamoneus TaxID=53446 RepID=A0A2G1XG91_STRCJ|nr:helix-turn-helix transcriptional regulator [Streptomyces cinnamoneus]PHQ50260.1 helix-turn-helix transcriptional regulator [Streptomyces cinnamoneus]PPT12954.1 LuxR family transcriptional regulator [Streptomyces cinnamoneus]